MNVVRRYGLLGMVAATFFVNCERPSEMEKSTLDHVPEDSARVNRQKVPCSLFTSAKLPKGPEVEYLQSIAEVIADANSAIFSGDLGIESLCIESTAGDWDNAEAHVDKGSIFIGHGFLKHTKSDDEVAAVVAHEMAHLALGHSIDKGPPELMNDPEYQRMQETARQKDAPILAKIKPLETQYLADADRVLEILDRSNLFTPEDVNNFTWYIGGLISQVYEEGLNEKYQQQIETLTVSLRDYGFEEADTLVAHLDAILRNRLAVSDLRGQLSDFDQDGRAKAARRILGENYKNIQFQWMEAEADNFGLEYLTRAGIPPEAVVDALRGVAERKYIDVSDCTYRPDLAEPQRGLDAHPSFCWRIFNAQREIDLHRNSYGAIPSENPTKRLPFKVTDFSWE